MGCLYIGYTYLVVSLLTASEGHWFTLFLLSDGSVYSCGDNEAFKLGLGKDNWFQDNPTKIPGLSNIQKISAGYAHSLALDKKGHVYVWGANEYGQLYPGGPKYLKAPKRLPHLKNISSISAASERSLALDSSGFVWEWGKKSNKVASSPHCLSELSNIVWIGAADIFSLALDKDGRLYCWQSTNSFINFFEIPKKPEPLPFYKKIISASAGSRHALFQSEDGILYGFGINLDYRFDSSSFPEFSIAPVELEIKSAKFLKSFVAGKKFSAFLTRNNRVYFQGTPTELNSNQSLMTYKSPTIIKISNPMYKKALFFASSAFPPYPKETESAWRKILGSEIAL